MRYRCTAIAVAVAMALAAGALYAVQPADELLPENLQALAHRAAAGPSCVKVVDDDGHIVAFVDAPPWRWKEQRDGTYQLDNREQLSRHWRAAVMRPEVPRGLQKKILDASTSILRPSRRDDPSTPGQDWPRDPEPVGGGGECSLGDICACEFTRNQICGDDGCTTVDCDLAAVNCRVCSSRCPC